MRQDFGGWTVCVANQVRGRNMSELFLGERLWNRENDLTFAARIIKRSKKMAQFAKIVMVIIALLLIVFYSNSQDNSSSIENDFDLEEELCLDNHVNCHLSASQIAGTIFHLLLQK